MYITLRTCQSDHIFVTFTPNHWYLQDIMIDDGFILVHNRSVLHLHVCERGVGLVRRAADNVAGWSAPDLVTVHDQVVR